MALSLEQFGLDRLTPDERRELIVLLEDSLGDDAPAALPDWHKELLDARLAAAEANPTARRSWPAAYNDLLKKYS